MMPKKYGRLAFSERIEIEKLLSHQNNYTDIPLALNRSKKRCHVLLLPFKQIKYFQKD